MKKFAVYTRNDILNLKDFLINSLGFKWSENMQKSPPTTPHSRIIFLSDLRISWVYSKNLPEEFILLEYKSDRAKFLHVLKKMYGDSISIPDNIRIHLSDERIELIKELMESYKERNKWQDTEKLVTLETIIDNGYYVYKHSDMLNELANQTNKPKPLTGDINVSSDMLDDLMDRVTDGTIDPSSDLFQELLKGLADKREQRRKEEQSRSKKVHDKWIKQKEPHKHWNKIPDEDKYDIFHDAAKQQPIDDAADGDIGKINNNKISSDQIEDSGWMDMTKDFISDMWRDDGSKRGW